jgi:hypothetical protein
MAVDRRSRDQAKDCKFDRRHGRIPAEAVGGIEEHGVLRLRSPLAHFAQDDRVFGLPSVYR